MSRTDRLITAFHACPPIPGVIQTALDIKGRSRVHDGDLRGLRTLAEESRVRKSVVVCLEREPRVVSPAIEVLPWRRFLQRLWAGDLSV